MEIKNYCHIRKDLIKQNLAVPVGDEHLFTKRKLRYRWFGTDEIFQIFNNKKWKEAYSIDFDF